MIQCATLRISKRMKNAVSISIAFCLDFLIRNENITSKECKTKKSFEIILHIGKYLYHLVLRTSNTTYPLETTVSIYFFLEIEIFTTKIVNSKSLKKICRQLLSTMNVLKQQHHNASIQLNIGEL